jgi:hypothetical protein
VTLGIFRAGLAGTIESPVGQYLDCGKKVRGVFPPLSKSEPYRAPGLSDREEIRDYKVVRGVQGELFSNAKRIALLSVLF